MPLQRAALDFGAEHSFSAAEQRLLEHYGIELSPSTIRRITLQHGEAAIAVQRKEAEDRLSSGWEKNKGAETIVAQADGSMIPVVTIAEAEDEDDQDKKNDARKRRQLGWKEVRLCMAHQQSSVQPIFSALIGTPDDVGDALFDCALRTGFGRQTSVHCVGDGAPWIEDQVARVFSKQASYLIDFPHLCGYLAAAAAACSPEDPDSWLEAAKRRSKDGGLQEVVTHLAAHLEPDDIPDDDAPVGKAHRYITNRPTQFDYKDALAKDLPIASGQVESGHGYVIQDRLKIPGAWWKQDSATKMLALRTLRANGDWDAYWAPHEEKPAA
jgi:hypothetical protein